MEYHPATVSLNAGEDALALPSDFLELIFLVLIKDNVRYVVDGRESSRVIYTERPSVTETGLPRKVARVADDLVFEVLTDAVYTQHWSYYRRLPVLTAVTSGAIPPNSNWWSEYAEEAFLFSCLNKLSLYVSGIPEGDKKKWETSYLIARENLRLRFAKEETGGATHRSTPYS